MFGSKSEGFSALMKHYDSGTNEIKYLLEKECDVLYECKWCREIFRSIITFTSHKRSSCRSMFCDLADELELAKKFQKRQRDERGDVAGPSKQGRVNLEAVLDERSRPIAVTLPHSKRQMEIMTLPKTVTKAKPVTEFVGGYQRLVDMPVRMAISSQIPDDRVVVVMPQEKSSRYGEMQLRNRRVDERYATFTTEQIKILERLPGDILMFAEVSGLQCKHSQCKSYRPFDSFECLVYHLNLTHHSASEDGHRCYFCDSKLYNTFEKLKNHLKLKHGLIRKNHMDARKKLARRSYKRVQDHEHRSISPAGYVENEDTVESENELDNGQDSLAPFLESPIKLEEPDSLDEPMPTLKRVPVRRGRRQKGRGAAIKPMLSPAKIRQLPLVDREEPMSQESSGAVEFNIGNIDEFLNIRSNETSLANQANKVKPAKTPSGKRPGRPARDTSQASSSTGSSGIKEEIEIEDGQKEINVDQLMETDSGEAELDEEGEPTTKRRKKPVSLIKGRIPRQRVQASRLSQDYVVPKKYASTTKMLSENQFRAFAKEQAKQFKKDKRTRRKRKIVPLDFETLAVSPNDGDSMSFGEGSNAPTRKRGPYKRKLVPKEPKSQSKCSSMSEGEDDDDVTERLIQQVTNSLVKPSTPNCDQREIKKEGSRSVETSSCPTPEPISSEGFILPPLNTAKGASSSQKLRKEDSLPPSSANTLRGGSTNASPMKTFFPSVMTGSELELLNYSPRAKKVLTEGVPKVSDETRGESASRRKQNFGDKNGENDASSDLKLVQMPGQQPLKPDDLTLLPVTLNTSQRRMLFGPLKPLYIARGGSDGLHQCAECGTVCKTLAEGHKHMVSHVRMIRLVCSLCDAGSFFCTDMRKHLMYRYCENLHYAPADMISPGTPCMDALTADKLIRITCTQNPGQTTFTKGKIISAEKPTPYFPDPRIEQRLLGSLRSVTRASPRKIVLTSRKKSPSDDIQQGPSTIEDSQSGDSQPLSQTFNGDDQHDYSSKDSTPPITTNDLLNQAESSAAPHELLIPNDNVEKRDTQYILPLTIRANPPIQPKTPSPSSSQEPLIEEPSQQLEIPQSDSAELPSVNQPSIRQTTTKPSILSRSPVKTSIAQDQQQSLHSLQPLATLITTPAFQPQSETMIVDTIEQMQAPSDPSTQQTTLTIASSIDQAIGEKIPEVNDPSSAFSFPGDQSRIIITDEKQ